MTEINTFPRWASRLGNRKKLTPSGEYQQALRDAIISWGDQRAFEAIQDQPLHDLSLDDLEALYSLAMNGADPRGLAPKEYRPRRSSP
jgi:hypothetical protein